MTIKEIKSYETSDGKIFKNLDEAERHDNWLRFLNWCNKNICSGGEWSSQMVAEKIFKHWEVYMKLGK